MASYTLFGPLTSVSFEDKLLFSTHQDLIFARSKSLKLPEICERRRDVWSIKPPDFSVKLYRSMSVPHVKESRTRSNPDPPTKKETRTFLLHVLPDSHCEKEPRKFITSFRPPDALECELMFIRSGKNLCESYKNPKPHDHRQLDEDVSDMVTSYEKDPGNQKLKLKHLDVIGSTRSELDCRSKVIGLSMKTFKPAEPQWDAKLLLPQTPWPPKSASFSRHRRRRGAYDAFLERVEEKLSRSWKTNDAKH